MEYPDQNAVRSRFDQISTTYENLYNEQSPLGHYFQKRYALVRQNLSQFNGGTVLDIGCGAGVMASLCQSLGLRYYGIDLSPGMISVCQARAGIDASVNFSVAEIQDMPFEAERFDVVLCLGVLEYVPETELDHAVSEIWRVLKPGGLLISSHLNEDSVYFRWSDHVVKRSLNSAVKFLKNMPHSLTDKQMWYVGRNSQERRFKKTDILRLYNARFKIETLQSYGVGIVLQPLDRIFPRITLAVNRWTERRTYYPQWAAWATLLCARKL